ncbi:MAG: peptidylprolyl isomerase [Planctomycetes bacterium]|nr:peptidylprolyl isomerase [Planctomycetota bacterium]
MKLHWCQRALLGLCLLAIAASAGFVVGAQETPGQGNQTTLEVGQVMSVGGKIITAEDLIARVWDNESVLSPEKRVLVPSLTYLRDVALLDLEAARMGLVLSPQEINDGTEQQLKTIREEVKRKSQGTLPFEDWLAQQGLTLEAFEAYVRDRTPIILHKRVLVNYFKDNTESLEAWHILVKKEEDAKAIYDELKALPPEKRRERFEELAVQKSIDGSSNLNKGRIGRIFRNAATLVPEAEDAVWGIKDGEVTAPIKSTYGWHVFMRRQTFAPVVKPLAQVRAALMKATDVGEDDFNTWVRWAATTQKYKIERRLPGYDCKPNQKGSK